jgi:hypothetical protein
MDLTVDTALSDDSLEENWYRFVSDNGDVMCTYPPGELTCGRQSVFDRRTHLYTYTICRSVTLV